MELRLGARPSAGGFVSPLADGTLASDLPLSPAARPGAPPRVPTAWPLSGWKPLFHGTGLAEGRLQQVRLEARGGLYRVGFDDGERWVVSEAGWIARVPPPGEPVARAEASWARALGAPAALLLAARAIHLLHASAVAGPRGVVALVAPSGGGKSTLAAAAAARGAHGLRRIADDQLPVRLGRHPAALPRYPQLKLGWSDWVGMEGEAEVPLAAVVEIAHAPGGGPPELARLEPAAACLALVRATVAARLFPPERLAAHLAAAGEAAEILPVYRLRFASGPEGLEPALAALATLAS